MYNRSQVAVFTTAIRAALRDPSVLDVSDHFAGYFDELGITITVKPETPDDQVRSLKEQIAPVLFQSNQPFQWIVMFHRGGRQIGVLFPDGLFTME
jgi:hypothetical protein